MKGSIMNDTQMELGFAAAARYQSRSQRRLTRAHWWFERMRHIVDRACDWETAPPPRPEQIWLVGTHRQYESATPAGEVRRPEERQVCV